MFYEFYQNNSGGSFIVNDTLCERVIIEADSEEEAISKGKELGMYWDGVSCGIDCSCCGDRWNTPEEVDLIRYQEEGWPAFDYSDITRKYKGDPLEEWLKAYGHYTRKEEPTFHERIGGDFGTNVYINNIEEYAQFMSDKYTWTTPNARIFYKDGTVKEIYSRKP